MKTIIVHETTGLIMRPSPPLSLTTPPGGPKFPQKQEKNVWHAHARYYATITFNQIVLSTSEADRSAARTLMDVYFQLFREVVSQRESEPTDDVVPTVEEPNDKRKEKTREKNQEKARGNHGKGKQVRGAAGFAEVQDSNAKLLGAILTGVNRALPFACLGGENAEYVPLIVCVPWLDGVE